MNLNKKNLGFFVSVFVPLCMQAQALDPEHDGWSDNRASLREIKKVEWTAPRSTRAAELPVSVDNSKSRYFPAVISQKGGSCAQASGIGYMFSYEINRMLDRDAQKSDDNIFAYLFTWNFLNGGKDEGGFVDEGLDIAVKYGVMTVQDYGYASAAQFKWESGYDKYLKAMRYRGKRILTFPSATADDILHIKQYLYDKGDGHQGGGVLTFSTQSQGWQMNDNYTGPSETGYKSILTRLGHDGAHALTIAGYDDKVEYTDAAGKTHRGAFIVVNTWGSYMHDKGRYYLPYHFFTDRTDQVTENLLSTKMTGIETRLHEPKVVYRIGMDYSSRDDIAFTLAASDKIDQTSLPLERHSPVIFNHQGGDYPMAGAYNNKGAVEFGLDYTDFLPEPDHIYKQYFLRILRKERGNKSGEGHLTSFSVIDYRNEGEPREYVCKEVKNTPLEWGETIFRICTVPWMRVSASPLRWCTSEGQISPGKTCVLRTATGKYAKMRFVGYDPNSGNLTVQYQLQHDGSRNFKED